MTDTVRQYVTTIPLRWRDLDVLGHVYQGRYQEWLDEARADVFAGVTGRNGYPFVLVNINVNFRHEVVRADGSIEIRTTVTDIGRSSVVLHHDFRRPDGLAVADGRSTLVAWDRNARASRSLTEQERAILGAG